MRKHNIPGTPPAGILAARHDPGAVRADSAEETCEVRYRSTLGLQRVLDPLLVGEAERHAADDLLAGGKL